MPKSFLTKISVWAVNHGLCVGVALGGALGTALYGGSALALRLQPETQSQLETWARIRLARWPGLAVSVVGLEGTKAQVVYQNGFGVAALATEGAPPAIHTESLFRVASLSKSMTSILLAQQLKNRGLSWPTRLWELDIPFVYHLKKLQQAGTLPNESAWRTVTLQQLASHTSGLVGEAPGRDRWRDLELLRRTGRYMSDAEMDVAMKEVRFVFEPGGVPAVKGIKYSNLAYNILARVVSGLSAKDMGSEGVSPSVAFQQQARRALFRPLGLERAMTFDLSRSEGLENFVRGFSVVHPESRRTESGEWLREQGRLQSPVFFEPHSYSGSSGLAISVAGMGRWTARMLEAAFGFSQELGLSEAEFLELLRPEAAYRSISAMAKGFIWYQFKGGALAFGHTGVETAYTAAYMIFPQQGLALTVLVNARGAPWKNLIQELYRIVRQDSAFQRRPQITARLAQLEKTVAEQMSRFTGLQETEVVQEARVVPANSPWKKMVGRYGSEFTGEVRISVTESGDLALVGGGKVFRLEWAPSGSGVAHPQAPPSGASIEDLRFILPFHHGDAGEELRFVTDSRGRVTQLVLANGYYYHRRGLVRAAGAGSAGGW